MDKHFLGFMLVFVLLIAAAVAFAGTDQITPNVARSRADLAVGATTVESVEQGASWLVKLLIGGIVTGVAAAAFAEARKAYKMWQKNSRRGRWTAGPNAQWRGQQSQLPKLRREDLMLLALGGRLPTEQVPTSKRRGMSRMSDEDQDIDLEMP